MPHVLLGLQGLCLAKPSAQDGHTLDPLTRVTTEHGACVSQDLAGTLSTDEFDEVIYDLVKFLNFLGELYRWIESASVGSCLPS